MILIQYRQKFSGIFFFPLKKFSHATKILAPYPTQKIFSDFDFEILIEKSKFFRPALPGDFDLQTRKPIETRVPCPPCPSGGIFDFLFEKVIDPLNLVNRFRWFTHDCAIIVVLDWAIVEEYLQIGVHLPKKGVEDGGCFVPGYD